MSCKACTQSALSLFIRQVAGIDIRTASRTPVVQPRITRQWRPRISHHTSNASRYSTAATAQASQDVAPENHPPDILFEGPSRPQVDNSNKSNKPTKPDRSQASKKFSREKSHNHRLAQWRKSVDEAEHDAPVTAKSVAHRERLQKWKEKVQQEQEEVPTLDAQVAKPIRSSNRAAEERKTLSTPSVVQASVSTSSAPPASPSTLPGITGISRDNDWRKNNDPQPWQAQKAAVTSKLQGGAWAPHRKLSPDALEGIRALHAQYPEQFPTAVLSEHFKISPEAIRRILKSKWKPSGEEAEDRRERWEKRGAKIWEKLVEQGEHAPKRWREMGIGAGGPRKGRREWLRGVRERDEMEGRDGPPGREAGREGEKKPEVIATKWEGEGEMGPTVGAGVFAR